MHFDEKPFICQCEKVDNKAYGFEILHFYELFSNDIMAVKGLRWAVMRDILMFQ